MRRVRVIGLACWAALFFMSGCGGNEPKLVSNQTSVANANSQSANSAQAGAPASSARATNKASTGEAVDTSEYDARVKQFEDRAKQKPNDAGVRKQLAHAYLERANVLTQARQYQAALGDYRRTLRYDPTNEEARYWSDTIVGILKQMNRNVPAEGAEPTPIKQ